MLYHYDNAIASDLSTSIDPASEASSIVKVIDAEGILDLVAQIQEDKIKFPIICLTRNPDTPVDTARYNFAQVHRGVPAAYDTAKNTLYLEKAMPIQLGYTMTVLTTNAADMDELVKELIFKYSSMYYITMDLPYEASRKMRFGITIDQGASIERGSGSFDYLSTGKLYETTITLRCEGAVLLSYTPKHMERFQYGGTEALPPQNL